jgi:hypothetical protein
VVLVEDPAGSSPEGPGAPNGVRALAAAIAGTPGVRAVAWEDAEAGAALARLRVRTDDLEAAALAIFEAAAALDVGIAALSSPAPSLGQLHAARGFGGGAGLGGRVFMTPPSVDRAGGTW